MITTEMDVEVVETVDIDEPPENKYRPELLKKWVESGRLLNEQIRRGEVKPQSVREVAAKFGVDLAA